MSTEQAMLAVIWARGTEAQQRRAALYRQHPSPTTTAALAVIYRKVVSS
jgi:hypothetical protein